MYPYNFTRPVYSVFRNKQDYSQLYLYVLDLKNISMTFHPFPSRASGAAWPPEIISAPFPFDEGIPLPEFLPSLALYYEVSVHAMATSNSHIPQNWKDI